MDLSSQADPNAPHSAERQREEARAVRAAEAARIASQGGRISWLLEGTGWMWLRPVLDSLMLLLAIFATLRWPGGDIDASAATGLVVFPPVVMTMLALRGLYARRLRVSILDGVAPVVSAISLGIMAVAAGGVYLFSQGLDVAVLVHLWALSLVAVGSGRIAAASAQRAARVRTLVGRPALIVGAGAVGAKVARRLQDNPDYGLRPIGFLDADPPEEGRISGLPVLGSHEDVEWLAALTGAKHVVLAFSRLADTELVKFSQTCSAVGLEVSIVPRLFEAVNGKFSYEAIGGMPLMALRPTQPLGRRFAVKHAFDRLVAGTAIALLSPLLIAIALAVKLTSPGPVCFKQRRVGRDGRAFDLLKFRSMRPAPARGAGFAPVAGSAPGGIEGTDRRTAIGKFLRRSSLDELPQLLNVLRGDMSLVGPRPERPEFVDLFSREIDRYPDRLRVRCGITGWAQVHGLRGQTSLTDRVEWDNFYIEHWSLALDAKILALTVIAVFRHAE